MSIKYKKLVLLEDGVPKYLQDENGVFLTSKDVVDDYISNDEIEQAIRGKITKRYFRVYLLHEDETIKEDITNHVILTGSLEKTYQQGQTRSLTLTLMNPEQIWYPSPIKGKLWRNTKFRLDMGVQLEDTVYWVQEGVFVVQDPDLSNTGSNATVTLQLCDKFGLLDGTISGTTEQDIEIPLGTNIERAMMKLLKQERNKMGDVYDEKSISFPVKYKDSKTAYTIKKTSHSTIGEILIDLANMISCDIFYDEYGHLVVRNNLDDLDYHNRTIAWNFKDTDIDLEHNGVTMKHEWAKIKNKIIVIGANINGLICKGVAENNNDASPYSVNGNFGIQTEIITDDLIYTPALCEGRALYELKKNAMRNIQIKFNCIYIPHIIPNDLVRWSFDAYNLLNEELVVQSVSIPLNPKELMSVSVTNIKELPL